MAELRLTESQIAYIQHQAENMKTSPTDYVDLMITRDQEMKVVEAEREYVRPALESLDNGEGHSLVEVRERLAEYRREKGWKT